MHTRMEPTVCIEAYNARIGTSPITMVDTPGHRSYSDMRDLGIELADWILLVVAGDEGVTEQTLECVFKARKLSRQLMIAITKVFPISGSPFHACLINN